MIGAGASFQSRVAPWLLECFGASIASDVQERGDRYLEESLELLQSHGYDPSRVATLRDYVWGRPVGEPRQEVGGVMVTLAAYCLATGIDMHEAGEAELARVWTKIESIRAKQASKYDIHSPLPGHQPPSEGAAQDDGNEFFVVPTGLHPNTVNLVARFATALAEKLAAAEAKYGYSDGWARADWMDECRAHLVEHIQKGDPRDVAAYCAFLWHHGEPTTPQGSGGAGFRKFAERAIPFLRDEGNKYADDGSNEPLELARAIEDALAVPGSNGAVCGA